VPHVVWTDGAGTRVEVIKLATQRGRIVAYKVTRAASGSVTISCCHMRAAGSDRPV
jgi:hypothetical protein